VSNPTHLGFTLQPIQNRLGRTMYAVQVAVLDQWNNVVADDGTKVKISIGTGQGGTLSGTTTRTTTGGLVTFTDLKISGGSSTMGVYTLSAEDTTVISSAHPTDFGSATSLSFTMTN
jgi:hypothetical protein